MKISYQEAQRNVFRSVGQVLLDTGNALRKHRGKILFAGAALAAGPRLMPAIIPYYPIFYSFKGFFDGRSPLYYNGMALLGIVMAIAGMIPSLLPSQSEVLSKRAIDEVTNSVLTGKQSESYTAKGYEFFPLWWPTKPVSESAWAEEVCRNNDNTKILLKVNGSPKGYMRPNVSSKWTQMNVAQPTPAHICGGGS